MSLKMHELNKNITALGLNMPPSITREAIAVCILPGGNLKGTHTHTRLKEVSWLEYSDDLWVAGTRGDPAYTRADVKGHIARNGQLPLRLETQLYAEHTPGQIRWIAGLLKQHSHIHHLLVSTADYHLNRGILTLIKMLQSEHLGRKLTIGRLPTMDPPVEALVAGSATSQSLEEELDRIELYQEKGDVATAEEFNKFISIN